MPEQPDTAKPKLSRPLLGFLLGSGIALAADLAICAIWGVETMEGTVLWWLFNFPSLPCLFGCVSLAGTPPMGEAEMTGWDYAMLLGLFVNSCVTWGIFGALCGWASKHLNNRNMLPTKTEPSPGEGPR